MYFDVEGNTFDAPASYDIVNFVVNFLSFCFAYLSLSFFPLEVNQGSKFIMMSLQGLELRNVFISTKFFITN